MIRVPGFRWVVIVVSFLVRCSLSQTTWRVPASEYPFLHLEANQIGNAQALARFFEKLAGEDSSKSGQVVIFHFGDSHVHGGFFPMAVRVPLQARFGNAGRGLILPFKYVHGRPRSILGRRRTRPSGVKDSYRILRSNVRDFDLIPPPTGVAGVAIRPRYTEGEIFIDVSSDSAMDYRFNRMVVLQDAERFRYILSGVDRLPPEVPSQHLSIQSENRFAASVVLPKLCTEIELCLMRTDREADPPRWYGVSLENGRNGILYHSMGIDGATYETFLQDSLFAEQMSCLQPDLILISLGTNDAFGERFDTGEFLGYVNQVITALRQRMPNACYLLTTPGDCFRKRNKPVPAIAQASIALIKFCLWNRLAYWDFHEVMGGVGSMKEWSSHGLSSHDFVHLSKPGYELQGRLLAQALLQEYQAYVSRRAR